MCLWDFYRRPACWEQLGSSGEYLRPKAIGNSLPSSNSCATIYDFLHSEMEDNNSTNNNNNKNNNIIIIVIIKCRSRCKTLTSTNTELSVTYNGPKPASITKSSTSNTA